MDDERIRPMWMNQVLILCLLIIIRSASGLLCPNGCKCENEVLKANCSGAGIEVVPIQLNPELHVMDLSHNKITHLHYTFTFYEKLHILDLSKNKVKIIGSGNFKTQNLLTFLNLSSNYIEYLGKDSFEGLKQLAELDLSSNELKSIRLNAFKDLSKLTVLRMNGNQLDYIEIGTFKPTPELQVLFLDDNLFIDIPSGLSDLINLKMLSISRNLIEVIENDKVPNLPELSKLVLVQNLLFDIQPRCFSNLPKLDHLDISDNNLTVFPTAPLTKLQKLTNLKLSGNTFKNIPPVACRGLFQLKYLMLNRIESLESIDVRAFVDNINLEKISMDYNYNIKTIPTRLFHGNPMLRYVSIRFNLIKSLVSTHFPLDQLEELRVGGNPFDCNCSMEWLRNILHQSEVPINNNVSYNHKILNNKPLVKKQENILKLDVHDIICETPEELHNKKLFSASQRQMDCSMSWLAIISVSLTVFFILGAILGVFFFMPKKKPSNDANNDPPKTSKPHYHPSAHSPTRKSITNHNVANIERYIMPPILLQNRSLSMWDPYSQNCNSNINIYEKLNEHPDRPHIVYV